MHLSHTINDQEDGLRRSELSPINVAGCWSTIKGVKGGIFLFSFPIFRGAVCAWRKPEFPDHVLA